MTLKTEHVTTDIIRYTVNNGIHTFTNIFSWWKTRNLLQKHEIAILYGKTVSMTTYKLTFRVYLTSALEEYAHHLNGWKCYCAGQTNKNTDGQWMHRLFMGSDETRQHVLFVQISSSLEQKLNLTTCCAQMFSSAPTQIAPQCWIVVLIRTKVNARLLRKHSYRHYAIVIAKLHKTKYSSPCKSGLPYVTASNHLCCLSSWSFLTTCFMTNW